MLDQVRSRPIKVQSPFKNQILLIKSLVSLVVQLVVVAAAALLINLVDHHLLDLKVPRLLLLQQKNLVVLQDLLRVEFIFGPLLT